ncbi:MAG: hypothetical protein A2Y74_06080 [Actinobacteria bacterium RBG_13_63_9]|nr:MAG: hypothetical protein A2Y74_06080 [Actinobacteria bacterium RBG_13_63_9]
MSTNELLGNLPDARLLIINADDFGMCHTVNEATMYALKQGMATSCTLMVPCPWSLHGLRLLKENPDIPFGVHLTAVSEWTDYRWGPVTPRQKVPSLVDEAGYFYGGERIDEFVQQVNLAELESEFRAQIEVVFASGLKPTHLDSHCGVHDRRDDVFEMTFGLAREYGLALRMSERPWITKLQAQGYPTNDHPILDSYRIETPEKPSVYRRLLHELPPGLSEWAVHPGTGTQELRAITSTWHVRQADFDFFTSQEAREVLTKEGIVLLNYHILQNLWQA